MAGNTWCGGYTKYEKYDNFKVRQGVNILLLLINLSL